MFSIQEKSDEDEKNLTEAVNGVVVGTEGGDGAGEGVTPQSSPARAGHPPAAQHPVQQGLKHSDSSFGLHSPDSFNDDVQVSPHTDLIYIISSLETVRKQ